MICSHSITHIFITSFLRYSLYSHSWETKKVQRINKQFLWFHNRLCCGISSLKMKSYTWVISTLVPVSISIKLWALKSWGLSLSCLAVRYWIDLHYGVQCVSAPSAEDRTSLVAPWGQRSRWPPLLQLQEVTRVLERLRAAIYKLADLYILRAVSNWHDTRYRESQEWPLSPVRQCDLNIVPPFSV